MAGGPHNSLLRAGGQDGGGQRGGAVCGQGQLGGIEGNGGHTGVADSDGAGVGFIAHRGGDSGLTHAYGGDSAALIHRGHVLIVGGPDNGGLIGVVGVHGGDQGLGAVHIQLQGVLVQHHAGDGLAHDVQPVGFKDLIAVGDVGLLRPLGKGAAGNGDDRIGGTLLHLHHLEAAAGDGDCQAAGGVAAALENEGAGFHHSGVVNGEDGVAGLALTVDAPLVSLGGQTAGGQGGPVHNSSIPAVVHDGDILHGNRGLIDVQAVLGLISAVNDQVFHDDAGLR